MKSQDKTEWPDGERRITSEEALAAFHELPRQASKLPKMTLEEINAEISAARAAKDKREGNKPSD